MTHRSSRFPLASALLPLVIAACAAALLAGATPRFLSDDPLARDPESGDAAKARRVDIGLTYEMAFNLFVTSQRNPSHVHALNVNTIDEVPDSSWFTNRMLPRTVTSDAIVRGPNTGTAPNPERWTITREKSAGFSPGFTAKDANGETWFLSFDTPGHAEGASGAMVVASKIFWALGYNQVETFITTFDPKNAVIDPAATVRRPNGKRTPMKRDDFNAVLERAARNQDGTYRAAAGRLLPGTPIGPFRYEGSRPDDPNDLVPHEHRRELRALRVFGAWTNLTDLKAGNTLDTLVSVGGRSVIRHYLQDVGSTFGIGANGAHDWDEGFEYYYEPGPSHRRLLTLGLARSPWQTADYTEYPSIGRFESEQFDPITWKPHSPTAAYVQMLPEDAFWAARRVAAFDDDLIRAIVHTGQFSDPTAEQHLAAILIQRRDKIARAYLPAVAPIVNPALSTTGDLTFDNAAVAAHVAGAPSAYVSEWSQFDNLTGATRPIGRGQGSGSVLTAPSALPSAPGEIVQIDVAADSTAPAAWQRPVHLHFRRAADGWQFVGLDRTNRAGGATPPTTARRER